jgi:hypothetical protein
MHNYSNGYKTVVYTQVELGQDISWKSCVPGKHSDWLNQVCLEVRIPQQEKKDR